MVWWRRLLQSTVDAYDDVLEESYEPPPKSITEPKTEHRKEDPGLARDLDADFVMLPPTNCQYLRDLDGQAEADYHCWVDLERRARREADVDAERTLRRLGRDQTRTRRRRD